MFYYLKELRLTWSWRERAWAGRYEKKYVPFFDLFHHFARKAQESAYLSFLARWCLPKLWLFFFMLLFACLHPAVTEMNGSGGFSLILRGLRVASVHAVSFLRSAG